MNGSPKKMNPDKTSPNTKNWILPTFVNSFVNCSLSLDSATILFTFGTNTFEIDVENCKYRVLICPPTPYTATAVVPANLPKRNLSTLQFTWSIIWFKKMKNVNTHISLSKLIWIPRNINLICNLLKQKNMLDSSNTNVRNVVTDTIPIEPYPIINNGSVKKGLKTFWSKIRSFWNRNFSCAVIEQLNTLFGNVIARLIISIPINIRAVSYSASVRPVPKITRIFPIITLPHKMQITEIEQKIIINIPFSFATPASSFCALYLE